MIRTPINARIPYNLTSMGLAGYFVLLPFEYILTQYFPVSFLMLVGVATMGLAVVDIARQAFTIKVYKCAAALIVWCIYVGLTLFWTIDENASFQMIPMYLRNTIMLILICMVPFKQFEVELLKKAYIIGLVLILAYMSFVPGATTYSLYGHRLTLATVSGKEALDQNYLSAIILLPYCLSFFEIYNNNHSRLLRIFYSVICIASLYYILATGSRSGLIIAIGIALIVFLMNAKKNFFIGTIIIFCIWLILPSVLDNMSIDVLDRYSLEALTGQTEESGSRLLLWAAAGESLKNIRVIFGYGAGVGRRVVSMYSSLSAGIHNFYIAHIVEMGIVGASGFLIALVDLFKATMKNKQYPLMIGALSIMIIGFFLDLLTTKFFWCAMLLLAVNYVAEKTYNCL